MIHSKIRFSTHALTRMFQRGIPVDDVRLALESETVIEEYPEDQPYPSALVMAIIKGNPIHIVRSVAEDCIVVITAYRPDTLLWDSSYMKRR